MYVLWTQIMYRNHVVFCDINVIKLPGVGWLPVKQASCDLQVLVRLACIVGCLLVPGELLLDYPLCFSQ